MKADQDQHNCLGKHAWRSARGTFGTVVSFRPPHMTNNQLMQLAEITAIAGRLQLAPALATPLPKDCSQQYLALPHLRAWLGVEQQTRGTLSLETARQHVKHKQSKHETLEERRLRENNFDDKGKTCPWYL